MPYRTFISIQTRRLSYSLSAPSPPPPTTRVFFLRLFHQPKILSPLLHGLRPLLPQCVPLRLLGGWCLGQRLSSHRLSSLLGDVQPPQTLLLAQDLESLREAQALVQRQH